MKKLSNLSIAAALLTVPAAVDAVKVAQASPKTNRKPKEAPDSDSMHFEVPVGGYPGAPTEESVKAMMEPKAEKAKSVRKPRKKIESVKEPESSAETVKRISDSLPEKVSDPYPADVSETKKRVMVVGDRAPVAPAVASALVAPDAQLRKMAARKELINGRAVKLRVVSCKTGKGAQEYVSALNVPPSVAAYMLMSAETGEGVKITGSDSKGFLFEVKTANRPGERTADFAEGRDLIDVVRALIANNKEGKENGNASS